ncbi:uncharacterized protein TRIVIDRAFT_60500 [Trichoderma virens Gv29-8]|uniref:C2H2-type domain-containing protein n=1 Tax=Hypocrea virens (strain Gv29-8 / FGSC 10586) TaxID=413071 RepID=G9MRD3_HYPVG|nr:uncharacterized protein TRIVIDRAFT_60500 [Trichoderma virens Gv29-8]EHK22656.1 hypothetical protein TRIVIDRAFT_60500 [Trichoderma virens Gv29-8]UKZ47709.1 hypothetical protein TrVGV298_001935 [Trichoderma virens]
MCTTNIYTYVYPDGHKEQSRQPVFCSASRRGKVCINNVVFQHPTQYIPIEHSQTLSGSSRSFHSSPFVSQFPPTPEYTPPYGTGNYGTGNLVEMTDSDEDTDENADEIKGENTDDKKDETIAIRATQCLESFQKCLQRASSVHPREFSVVEDQMARLSTWTAGIGVFAPGRASIDHRLRYAPEVQSAVTGLLESLDYRIRACSDVLDEGKFSAPDTRSAANERLEWCFVDITTELSRLEKTANTIGRASNEAHVLNASDFQIKDVEGNNVESLLLRDFERHIGRRFPNISKIIQQRLARTMLLRQKRILHRRHYQGNTDTQPQEATPKGSITLLASQLMGPAIILSSGNVKIVSFGSSVISARKTAVLSTHEALIFPPAPSPAAERKYKQRRTPRVADTHNTSRLVKAKSNAKSKKKPQAIGEITCPYCLYMLPAQEASDELAWRNHVKNDLDPYVCLFEDCQEADLLYNDSDEWLSHLHQHNKLWRCSSHRDLGPFSTREDYIKHIREAHNINLSDTQLRVLAKKNARKAVKLFLSCPMCGKNATEVDGRLEDHIAGHLLSLALKSLPSF